VFSFAQHKNHLPHYSHVAIGEHQDVTAIGAQLQSFDLRLGDQSYLCEIFNIFSSLSFCSHVFECACFANKISSRARRGGAWRAGEAGRAGETGEVGERARRGMWVGCQW